MKGPDSMVKTLKLIDIYCGAGGLSSGFASANLSMPACNEEVQFELIYGVDNNSDAIQTFRNAHFPNLDLARQEVVAPCTDIKYITADKIREATGVTDIDVIIGGPNCQGVSAAGLRNPGDNRNQMLTHFIALVRDLRPKWFVMENVPGLTHENNRDLLEAILLEFQNIPGYQVNGDVLLAADFGVPQLRYRLFIIGTNTGCPITFPKPTHRSPLLTTEVNPLELASRYLTVRDAIYDLNPIPPYIFDEDLTPESMTPPNHYCMQINEINISRIAAVKEGEDWRSIPVCLLPERYFATRISDQKGAYGRLSWNWPAYTITNETSNVTAGPFTHPSQHRSLSVREAARLQSFTDKHVFYGSVLSQYNQIGNAVPPLLAKAVAQTILLGHFSPQEALVNGKVGRITLDVLRSVKDKKSQFPTLTPRIVNPATSRKSKKVPAVKKDGLQKSQDIDVWSMPLRSEDPFPAQLEILTKLASQPRNFKATKRAKAILQFIEGVSKDQIISEARVAEDNVKKWINGYYAYGLEGWRAYNTPAQRIANYDQELALLIGEAIFKARQFNFENSDNQIDVPESKRLHMNDYLLQLQQKFGDKSIRDLLVEVEERLGYGVGTIYLSDLLAICDVVLDDLGTGAKLESLDSNQYSEDITQQ